jgi:hypothetical protein
MRGMDSVTSRASLAASVTLSHSFPLCVHFLIFRKEGKVGVGILTAHSANRCLAKPYARPPSRCWSYEHEPNNPRLMGHSLLSYILLRDLLFQVKTYGKFTACNRQKQSSVVIADA